MPWAGIISRMYLSQIPSLTVSLLDLHSQGTHFSVVREAAQEGKGSNTIRADAGSF